MKTVVFSLIFACLVFPAFSQTTNADRFRALDTSMNSTITSSTSKLRTFDQLLSDTGHTRIYMSYRGKFETLSKALQESELQLNRLIQFNDRPANIKAERDNYAVLIRRLEALKTEYNTWLSSVQ